MSATEAPQIPAQTEIDPSLATAITTGNEGSHLTNGSAAPAYTANAANGEASSGPTTAAPEKGAEQPSTTTTTTTIITTTTSPQAEGSSLQSPQLTSAPVATGSAEPTLASPINGSSFAPQANGAEPRAIDTATSPVQAADGGVVASPVSNDTAAAAAPAPAAAEPTTLASAAPAAAAVGAAGAVPAGAAAAEEPKAVPELVMKPKEAKKYTKLLKKEAKNDEKDLAQAIKDAHSLEKPLRKATKAEQQSEKRHQSAVHDDHKAAKKFNRAKAEYEKTQAVLQKALDELDIKKNHTKATQDAFETAKRRIDELRDQKIANDQDRSRRQASITTTR